MRRSAFSRRLLLAIWRRGLRSLGAAASSCFDVTAPRISPSSSAARIDSKGSRLIFTKCLIQTPTLSDEAAHARAMRLSQISGKHRSCECQACSRMQSLDVKFVVHLGEFIRQKMSGREELAGRDVILVHRLLKNEVGKTLARASALYSDACVQAMGIDPGAQGLLGHAEAIEHIGETKCWVSDLEHAWTQESESAHAVVQRADAIGVLETDFSAPQQRSGISSPSREIASAGREATAWSKTRPRAGAAPARQNHCMHGKDAIIEDILDCGGSLYLL